MHHRVELLTRSGLADPKGDKLRAEIRQAFGWEVGRVRSMEAYVFRADHLGRGDVEAMAEATLRDPVLHDMRYGASFGGELEYDWAVEVGFRAGVTDNVGRTAHETFNLWLERPLRREDPVHSSRGWFISGGGLDRAQVGRIAGALLMNELIESAEVFSRAEWADRRGGLARAPEVSLKGEPRVERFRFADAAALMEFGRARTLALSLDECRTILEHYARPEVAAARAAAGIGADPTDVELEVLAQTWSEHCKHKIFGATVEYRDEAAGTSETIRSLYKTYIKAATYAIRDRLGADDWCVSVFEDNAGVVKFNQDWHVSMKVETHNSPSALDPYGGALTGIVGVNRDTVGTGMGGQMIFNTDVFCFASPFHDQPLPPKLMHPRRIFEGVRLGVEHGGNKSGVPTVNGAVVFHERFLGKPLVFCGTGGLMPSTLNGAPSHHKGVLPGDRIVMCGGRIGKDGIHGATFSSEALHEGSPATAVQIGDPIVQKRMVDFLLEARDRGLFRCITDNGAGGLSSSVGEMARFSGGCRIELDKAPLKYPGLQPWEVFVSEAQERMTLAVPPERLAALLALSGAMGVESTDLGAFTDSGALEAVYGGETVALLDMAFMHEGLPAMNLKAVWTPPPVAEPALEIPGDLTATLKAMLGRLNVCSKERIIRQYDHEVQGGSVVKPLVGADNDGPSDAAVVRPVLDSLEGLAVANGICPRYSDIDAYHMAACAVDEAVRNVIVVGANPERIAGLDNFCWCDPVASADNPDGEYKMAQLVRANKALFDLTTLYGVPMISGKDSMKNDYRNGATRISIPPTVLFTAVGKVEDVRRCVTMDAKSAGDWVYLLGETRDELGGGELYDHLGFLGANVPKVDGRAAWARYRALARAIQSGLIRSAHDCSEGGVAVALAETAFAGGLGMDLELGLALRRCGLREDRWLFSETPSRIVVTVAPEHKAALEAQFAGQAIERLGMVTAEPILRLRDGGRSLVLAGLAELKSAWKSTLA